MKRFIGTETKHFVGALFIWAVMAAFLALFWWFLGFGTWWDGFVALFTLFAFVGVASWIGSIIWTAYYATRTGVRFMEMREADSYKMLDTRSQRKQLREVSPARFREMLAYQRKEEEAERLEFEEKSKWTLDKERQERAAARQAARDSSRS